MPPELNRIKSFNPDCEDWYSCHTSDDEAYQDAIERNSVASFYTARGAASVRTSIGVASNAPGSPARLADADQALAEMVHEPISDSRPQHDPPELDAEDAQVSKRTRSVCAAPSACSPPRAASTTPAPKAKSSANRQLWPLRRGAQPVPLRTVATTTASTSILPPAASAKAPSQPDTPSALTQSFVRATISLTMDGSSVRLHIAPAIFCFGDVPLPFTVGAGAGPTLDYSAVLLGADGGVATYENDDCEADLTTPVDEPAADIAVKLVTRPRGMTLYKSGCGPTGDPATSKDQDKAFSKRQQHPEDKDRKPAGFPGAFLHRLFTGFRRRGATPPPATLRELGSELLMSSAAATRADLASAAQRIPVLAGYVHAAPPAAAAAAAAPAAGADVAAATMDDAAAAVHRLSEDIFRKVIRRASAGGGDAPAPKTLVGLHDTDIAATAAAATDHMLAAAATGAATAIAPALSTASPQAWTAGSSPSFGEAPLVKATTQAKAPRAEKDGMEAPTLTPTLSVEALDCSGLPMPELEQCESPTVTAAAGHHPATPGKGAAAAKTRQAVVGSAAAASTVAAAEDGAAAESVSKVELVVPEEVEVAAEVEVEEAGKEEAGATMPITTAVDRAIGKAAAADVSSAPASVGTASPRTASKRAYGTVARLVKKMTPNFRDSSVMSLMTSSSANLTQASMCVAAVPMAPAAVQSAEVLESEAVAAPAGADADEAKEPEVPEAEVEQVLAAPSPAYVVAAVAEGDSGASVDEAGAALLLVDGAAVAEVAKAATAVMKERQEEATEEGSDEEAPLGSSVMAASSAEKEAPVQLADAALKQPAGAAIPALFVFGQEQPKAGKSSSTGRSRSVSSKSACATAGEDAAAGAAGRKRKGGDEILPTAKVPVVTERSTSSTSVNSQRQEPVSTPGEEAPPTAAAVSETAPTPAAVAVPTLSSASAPLQPSDSVSSCLSSSNSSSSSSEDEKQATAKSAAELQAGASEEVTAEAAPAAVAAQAEAHHSPSAVATNDVQQQRTAASLAAPVPTVNVPTGQEAVAPEVQREAGHGVAASAVVTLPEAATAVKNDEISNEVSPAPEEGAKPAESESVALEPVEPEAVAREAPMKEVAEAAPDMREEEPAKFGKPKRRSGLFSCFCA